MYQRVAQVGHGGTTPQTPQTRPVSLEAEEITRRNLDVRPQGESIDWGCRGRCTRRVAPECIGAPSGAHPRRGGWGGMGKQRGGHDQGQVVIDHGKDDERRTLTEGGGCTLSRAPKLREVRTYRNHFNVDGSGGRDFNNLDEDFRMRATRDHSTMNSETHRCFDHGRVETHVVGRPSRNTWPRSQPGCLRPLAKVGRTMMIISKILDWSHEPCFYFGSSACVVSDENAVLVVFAGLRLVNRSSFI